MASQPSPGDRTPRTPLPASSPSSQSSKSRSYSRKVVVLFDWWLERMDGKICIAGRAETPQMRNGALSSKGKLGSVGRVFKGVVAKRCDSFSVETVSGCVVLINGILNDSGMCKNGFSQEVCESFMDGFPIQWNKLVDSSMEHIDGHPELPLDNSDSADEALIQHYYEMFMSDSFLRKEYSFAQNYSGSLASSDLVQPRTHKCCETSVKTENISEENEYKTVLTGRLLGGPLSAPKTGANKLKRTQQEAFNNKGLANEAISPTAYLTSHENSPSVAGIVAEDKTQSHDSHGKERKKATSRSMSKVLFTNMEACGYSPEGKICP